jgi:hypothetical protein
MVKVADCDAPEETAEITEVCVAVTRGADTEKTALLAPAGTVRAVGADA